MKDRIVLITGGSQGYGKAAAKAFTQAGSTVVIAARGEEALQQTQRKTGCAGYVAMDVTRPEKEMIVWEIAQTVIPL
jgi:NADP-dependent 3-hydroxy acid dehydrogenase YdfG